MTMYAQGGAWLTWVEENNEDATATARFAIVLAKDMAKWYGENRSTLTRVQWALGATFVGVAVQLMMWTIAILLS